MTLFAGYSDLDQWLRHIDTHRPAYALSLTQTHHSAGAHATQVTHITLSQPTPDGATVNYIRIRTATRNFVAGQPWDEDSADRHRKAITAWHNTLATLAEHRIDTIPAAIAAPADLVLLDADADTIPACYDFSTMTCHNCQSADVEATNAERSRVHTRCRHCRKETAWLPVVRHAAPDDAEAPSSPQRR